MNKKLLSSAAIIALGVGFAGSANATPVELITNGGFETGDFTGWTINDGDGGEGGEGGTFFIDDADGLTPDSGQDTVGPASGDFYAVSDQNAETLTALSQSITVGAGATSVILSFDMFTNNFANLVIDPGGLTLFPDGGEGNQHGRVDLLLDGFDPFDTGAGVLANFFIGGDPLIDGGEGGGPDTANPYTHFMFDITALVAGGGTFTIRFAEVNTNFFFNMGVDNVSVMFDDMGMTPVPEPASLALLGAGLAGIGLARRRRRK